MATIHDIGRIAGGSAKTVSRVRNGDAPVGQETRAAGEAAMAGLGYVPNNALRMMRAQRSGWIGPTTVAISMSPKSNQPAGLLELSIVTGIQKARISGLVPVETGPSLIAGPVHWRDSVTELSPANVTRLKTVKEERRPCSI